MNDNNFNKINRINLLRPYPFKGDDNVVYGKVIAYEADLESGIIDVQISLINDRMIDYDSTYFSKDNQYTNIDESLYRPYFYEFFARTTDKRVFNYSVDDDIWWVMKIEESGKSYEENQLSIDGDIIFSASPIQASRNSLVITDVHAPTEIIRKALNIDDIKDDLIDCSRSDDLKDMIEDVLGFGTKSIDKIVPTIFNVGQGNCSYVQINDKGFFYDLGFTKDYSKERHPDNIDHAVEEISSLMPDMIILSHWDFDHILGIVNADDIIYRRSWIVPNLLEIPAYKRSAGACRLIKYLSWNPASDLYAITDDFNDDVVYQRKDYRMEIWKGSANPDPGDTFQGKNKCLTKANNYGLIVKLNNNRSMLLTGDCEYHKVPGMLKLEEHDFLIVPHHGSDMIETSIAHVKDGTAIIPVGYNSYGHPCCEHKMWLRRQGYKNIVETRAFAYQVIRL